MLIKQQMKGVIKASSDISSTNSKLASKTSSENDTSIDCNVSQESSGLCNKSQELGSIDMLSQDSITINASSQDSSEFCRSDLDILEEDLCSDDEDELTLRYKALKSAIGALNDKCKSNNSSQNTSPTHNTEDSINVDEILQSKSEFEKDLQKALTISLLSDEDSSSSSFSKKSLKDNEGSDQELVDMDICDSSEEDNVNMNIDMRNILKEIGDETDFKNNFVSQNSESSLLSGNGFQIPVKWAYMIPPPPPPDQPPNDLKRVDSWCYDQNLYVQTMQETNNKDIDSIRSSHIPCQDYNVDLNYSHMVQNNEAEINDSPQFEHPECYNNDENLPTNTNIPVPYDDLNLKDKHARQYEAFMSSIIQQTKSTTRETRSNLVKVKIQPNLTTKRRKLTKRQRLRRNRENKKSNLKDKNFSDEKEIEKDSKVENEIKELSSNSCRSIVDNSQDKKDIVKNKKVSVIPQDDDDDDEDLLRAQLLIDVSMKRQNKADSELTQQISVPKTNSEKSVEFSSNSYQQLEIPRVDKESRPYSVKNYSSYSKINVISNPMDRMDYYLETLNVPELPKFKYPPVKPVIINLNSDSDSDSEDESSTVFKTQNSADLPSSSKIHNFLKSMRVSTSSDKIENMLSSLRNSSNIVLQNKPVSNQENQKFSTNNDILSKNIDSSENSKESTSSNKENLNQVHLNQKKPHPNKEVGNILFCFLFI